MKTTPKITKIDGVNYTLYNLLMGYTKSQQREIADSLNCSMPKSWKKDKAAKALSEHIKEQAETIYQEVLEGVINRFPNQEQSAYVVESLEGISSLNPLIDKGFIYIHKVNDTYMLIIPEDILKAATDFDGEWLAVTQEAGANAYAKDIIHSWKENVMAIYGTVSAKHLHQIWNRHHPQKLTIEEIRDMLSN